MMSAESGRYSWRSPSRHRRRISPPPARRFVAPHAPSLEPPLMSGHFGPARRLAPPARGRILTLRRPKDALQRRMRRRMLRRSNGPQLKERPPLTLDDLARQAHFAAEGVIDRARTSLRERVSENGKLSADRIEADQHAVHGLAWLATYVEAIKEMATYARRMQIDARFGDTEQLLTRVGLGEYLAQIFGAIPMNQGEIVRLADFGLEPHEIASFRNEAVEALIASGNTRENRAALAALIDEAREGAIGDPGLDETFEAVRGEMRRFADGEVVPHAQSWHRANAYIPLEVIAGLSAMGVFGLTIPEAYGGMELGKVAMCVVSEELSRGYIG